MNKETAKDYLPLVQALAEGRVIQEAFVTFGDPRGISWRDIVGDTTLTGSPECYRIKPEPREIWVNEYVGGARYSWDTETEARENVAAGGITRRYREVIEQ